MQTTSPSRAAKIARLARIAAKLHAHVEAANLETAAAVIGGIGGGQTCIAVLDVIGAPSEAPTYLEHVAKFFSTADEDAKDALLGLAAQGLIKAPILAFITMTRGVTTVEGSAESKEIEARLKAGDALKDVEDAWTVFIMERTEGDIIAFRLEGGKWGAGILGSITAVAEGDSSAAFDLPGALRELSAAVEKGEEALLDDIANALNGGEVAGSEEYRARMAEAVKRLKASDEDEKVTNAPRIEIIGIHATGKAQEGPALVWTSGGKRHVLLLDADDIGRLLTDIVQAAKELPGQLVPALIAATAELMDGLPPIPERLHPFVPDSLKEKLGIMKHTEEEVKAAEERLVRAIFGQHKPGGNDDAETPDQNA